MIHRPHARRENGSVSVMVVMLGTAFFALAGLGIDGAAGLVAAQHANDLANDAARAGARDGTSPSVAGPVVLDPSRAWAGATAWLAAEGVNPELVTVSVAADTVTVTVRQRHPTSLLRLVGVDHLDLDATASAHPLQGITAGGTR